MSFGDWVSTTRQRFQAEPTPRAVRQSAREFIDGARARVFWPLQARRQVVRTTLADEQVRFIAESMKDAKRARSALNETGVIEWLLQDGDGMFWDVGAYHGTYSVVAGSKGFDVVAFEPFPENQQRLQRNAEINGVTIDLREFALSDQSTMQLFGGGVDSELGIDEDGDTAVETWRGDELEPVPDIVKIDVEGHELQVIDGMMDTLDAVRRVAVEVHNDGDVPLVESALSSRGLRVGEIDTPRTQTYVCGVRDGQSLD